jgi:hypothetical protein
MPTDHLERARRLLYNAGSKPRHLPGILRVLRGELEGKPLSTAIDEILTARRITTPVDWNARALDLARRTMEVLSGRPYRRGRPGLSTRNLEELAGLHVELAEAKDEAARSYKRKAIKRRMHFASGVPSSGKVPRAPYPRRRVPRPAQPVLVLDWNATPLRTERAARRALDQWRADGVNVHWRAFIRACGESWPHAIDTPEGQTERAPSAPTKPAPRFMSASEAARALGVCRDTMQVWCARGAVKARRLGDPRSRWRLEAKDLDGLMLWLGAHRPATARRVAAHLRGAA